MAKTPTSTVPAPAKTNPPAKPLDFERDAGAGLEGADKDSYAIPFLVILQPLSPQVAQGTVAGAKPGMLLNSVTNELFEEALIVPCAFQRRWVRWAPRETGGGFKGELSAVETQELIAKGEIKSIDNRLFFKAPDSTFNERRSDRLSDTRNHYVLVLRSEDDAAPRPMVLALASTGIKHSKNFMSRIESIKLRRQNGTLYTPPSFSHLYAMKTVKQSNEKGTWWSPDITTHGPVKSSELYEMAKAFHDSVTTGGVQVAHDSVAEDSGTGAF